MVFIRIYSMLHDGQKEKVVQRSQHKNRVMESIIRLLALQYIMFQSIVSDEK